jgi:deoxyribonuclease V
MIAAFDAWYDQQKARTACVLFHDWTDEQPAQVISDVIDAPADYEPGAFYKRELPCILHLLDQLALTETDLIIIDGYVVLNDQGALGLGGRLYELLDPKIPVIGVAKTHFAGNDLLTRPVFRGQSEKPLYVSAVGIDLDVASSCVEKMAGPYRVPTLLKFLDQVSKQPIPED